MDLDVVRARFLLNNFCEGSLIIKTRYMIPYKGYTWYVDVFNGDNLGIILAEVELRNEDEYFTKPSWIGKEVTNDERYYNHNLSSNPYKTGEIKCKHRRIFMNPQYKEINDLIKQEIAEIREIDNFRKDELTRQYKYTRIMVMFVDVWDNPELLKEVE